MMKYLIHFDMCNFQLEQEMSKLSLLEIEAENRKRHAEMKELQLIELKKRYEKIASEKVNLILIWNLELI